MVPRRFAARLAVWLLASSVALAAFAQDEPAPMSAGARLDALERELSDPALDQSAAERIAREATALRVGAVTCERERQIERQRAQNDLQLLSETPDPAPADEGDPPADAPESAPQEPPAASAEVTARLDDLRARIRELDIEISQCKLTQLRAKNTADEALGRLSEILARRLMSQGRPALEALRDDLDDVPLAVAEIARNVIAPEVLGKVKASRMFIVAFTTLLAFGLGVLAQRVIADWSKRQRGRGGQPALRVVLARNASRWLGLVFAGLTASVALSLYVPPPAVDLIVVRFFYALTAFGIAGIFIDWCTGPYSPGADLLSDPETAAMVRPRARAVAASAAIGYASFGPGWLSGPPPESALVIRGVLTIFAGASLIWLVRGAGLVSAMRGRVWPLRAAVMLAAMGAVIAELLGYRNLSNHLLYASFGTILAAGVLWIAQWIIRTSVQGIVSGKADLSYRVRGWLGMRPNEPSAEIGWLRLILNLALWLSFLVVLILLWDSTGNAMPRLREVVTQGFAIGDERILVPKDIMVGLSVFGLIIALTAWIKARLSKRWLRDMGMDRGSREALVTLGGYVGFLIAVLAGLTLSGIDLSGLAIVLGALSVGIGFGLQNVVNNFVSGLILLFERPIKSGDFVSVGDVEGTVKEIRIRSTEIESLDRRNIIVPNSELVATQVTNWVLHDNFGRLSIPVGVAYGSDTQRVKEILEQVASDHPEVLKKGPVSPPRALFNGFGDSSLDFELRVWVRHVENRFLVTSDLNFAIDKAFREHNIEIPFPQRDLHVRSWSPGATPQIAPGDDGAHGEDGARSGPSDPEDERRDRD